MTSGRDLLYKQPRLSLHAARVGKLLARTGPPQRGCVTPGRSKGALCVTTTKTIVYPSCWARQPARGVSNESGRFARFAPRRQGRAGFARAGRGPAAVAAVRGPGLREHRPPPRPPSGIPRGRLRRGQDTGPDRRHRRADDRRRAQRPRHAGSLRGLRDPARAGLAAVHHESASCVTIAVRPIEPLAGRVAIVSAGTSDQPVAEEAAVTAAFFGATVDRYFDVGVAGLHRLLGRATEIRRAQVIVVVAGMEGALPSVVGGLVEAPVIAVPTSVGLRGVFPGPRRPAGDAQLLCIRGGGREHRQRLRGRLPRLLHPPPGRPGAYHLKAPDRGKFTAPVP